jgi:hypothetical protein
LRDFMRVVRFVLHQEVQREGLLLLQIRFLVGGRAELRMLQRAKHSDLFSAVGALHSSVQSAETRRGSRRGMLWLRSEEDLSWDWLNLTARPTIRPNLRKENVGRPLSDNLTFPGVGSRALDPGRSSSAAIRDGAGASLKMNAFPTSPMSGYRRQQSPVVRRSASNVIAHLPQHRERSC